MLTLSEMLTSGLFNVFGKLLLISLIFCMLDDIASKQFLYKSVTSFSVLVFFMYRKRITKFS